jgi:hypothetical protein
MGGDAGCILSHFSTSRLPLVLPLNQEMGKVFESLCSLSKGIERAAPGTDQFVSLAERVLNAEQRRIRRFL